ncbi:MAG: nitroreductase family protein [Bacteroidetes bacterium]|nr:nitroreductase family protein [Bacteroidota bacterium]
MQKEQNNNATLKIIHQRKTVKTYTGQKVSKEQLETLVRAGMAAPTAMNQQPWVFIAIDEKGTLIKLGEALPGVSMLKDAAAAIAVCGDMSKALEGPDREFWIQDCSAASQNILLAVESIELGAVWGAVFPSEERIKKVIKILNLPKHIIPLNVISIGYPTGEEQPKNKWIEENLHWQEW